MNVKNQRRFKGITGLDVPLAPPECFAAAVRRAGCIQPTLLTTKPGFGGGERFDRGIVVGEELRAAQVQQELAVIWSVCRGQFECVTIVMHCLARSRRGESVFGGALGPEGPPFPIAAVGKVIGQLCQSVSREMSMVLLQDIANEAMNAPATKRRNVGVK